ncbi:Polyketide biosynthesis cytochrome P450 PksS [Streptomyces sp. RB5]|uniref:Polyketide biosynthesis cytochrome P450 PksS n=1 Tax=Streptomyces smaragdinus TaxID=2585196 RepID=A0A7K0CD65_9ACTN|nr:cytochrome P450 [Streptomyces smaragdinus]MQY11405.1 Polyketide biosynthesis cytochrome P450 PksS [Streptomyces smaragdinus]
MTGPADGGGSTAGGCPAVHPDAVPLSGPRFHTEPQQLYREIRREHGSVVPVEMYGGFPAWLVIGYRELHQITSDPDLFSRDRGLWNQWPNVPADWPLLPVIGQPNTPSVYFSADKPHRRYAEWMSAALETVDALACRRLCEDLADRLIDEFCGRGDAELVAGYSVQLTQLTLLRLFGFPEDEGPVLAQQLNELVDGGPGAQKAHGEWMTAISDLVADKRLQPGSDIVSWLLANAEGFTDEEVFLNVRDTIGAGFLPTADWLAGTIRLMLTDDRFADALGGGRYSIGHALNEVLWEETPSQIIAGRWAARDTLLGGHNILAGDMILLGLGAANNDPLIQQHLTPAHGGNAAHFSYGYGEYRCPFPAQEIAEIIARAGIEVLLDRLPDLQLAVPASELVRRPSAFMRGMTELPVRFTPVPASGGTR